jgi:hypothetical protein
MNSAGRSSGSVPSAERHASIRTSGLALPVVAPPPSPVPRHGRGRPPPAAPALPPCGLRTPWRVAVAESAGATPERCQVTGTPRSPVWRRDSVAAHCAGRRPSFGLPAGPAGLGSQAPGCRLDAALPPAGPAPPGPHPEHCADRLAKTGPVLLTGYGYGASDHAGLTIGRLGRPTAAVRPAAAGLPLPSKPFRPPRGRGGQAQSRSRGTTRSRCGVRTRST